MTNIIAVANLKGGVGKSTIAVNLACALNSAETPAVVADADSQGTSSFWGTQGGLPIDMWAMPLEDRTSSKGWWARVVTSSDAEDRARVKDWQNRLKSTSAAYVVIDCPPHVGLATRAAIAVSDLVVVPVTATAVDLAATAPALSLVAQARKRRLGNRPECLIVPSKVDRSTATGRSIEKVLEQFGETVGPVIAQRVAFADSAAFGKWIGNFAPNSPGHWEILQLADAVKKLLPEH